MTAELDLIMDNAIDLAAAAAAAPEATIPQYPEWRMPDLVGHTGSVHRRTIEIAVSRAGGPVDRHPAPDLAPADLIDWFVAGAHDMVDVLADVPAWVPVWGFGPSPSIAAWRLRMALETSVHRIDAQRAVGDDAGLDADLAGAGVDEFGFMWLGGLPVPDGTSGDMIELHARDIGVSWTVEAGTRLTIARRSGEAPARLTGPASDLYLYLIGRRGVDALTLEGDAAVVDVFGDTLAAQRRPRS